MRPPPSGLPVPNIMLYGPPKTGKTTAACTYPGGKLLLNTDSSENATRYARSKRNDPEGQIMEPVIKDYEPGVTIGTPVLKTMGEITRMAEDPAQDFVSCVIVDPVHELYRLLLEEQSMRSMNPTLQQRLAVTTYLERFARALVKSPLACVFVFHELPVRDEAEETMEKLPFTGTSNMNLSQKLQGLVDIVAYTGVHEKEDGSKEYGAVLVHNKGRRGGDRFDALGKYQPLDLARWMRIIKAHEDGEPFTEDDTVDVSTSTLTSKE